MVQFRVLSGKKAGASLVTRRFPVRIGRSPKAHLSLEGEEGVWDKHLRLDFVPHEGYVLNTESDALMSVNGQPASKVLLRNGDVISLGSAKLQFWLAESQQVRLGLRECFTWLLIAFVCLAQVWLIYLLIKW